MEERRTATARDKDKGQRAIGSLLCVLDSPADSLIAEFPKKMAIAVPLAENLDDENDEKHQGKTQRNKSTKLK